MRQAAERGASLSRQLLSFARRQPLAPEPVDLPRQIEGMRELLDRTLRGDVRVETEFSADLWPVKVDPAELELVVLNLCINARDAMPDGGAIKISAQNAPQFCLEGRVGDFVSVAISDTGVGMSAEVLSHIFEPFFTTKDLGKGSGLGLPQVYGFVQQSGGAIKAESVLGRGTTITMWLPRSDVAPDQPAITTDDTGAKTRRRALMGSILLVEDDDKVASLVTEMFLELGYRVTRVASAQAALGALADDRDIDLVFSDVMMPGPLNGIDLAREMKRQRPEIAVLLTSGYAGSSMQAAEAESLRVLSKPYQLEALGDAVRAALAH
jgi:CheY-like chemotaxis protein